jgi:hypothetical protein
MCSAQYVLRRQGAKQSILENHLLFANEQEHVIACSQIPFFFAVELICMPALIYLSLNLGGLATAE